MKSFYLAICVAFLCDRGLAQQIIFVNQANTNPTANGTNWASAYHELRDALADPKVSAATSGNPVSVWIATGTYLPTTGTDPSVSFVLRSHLRLIGGFLGTESSPSQRIEQNSLPLNPSVLSGDIGRLQTNTVTAQTPLDTLATTAFQSADPGFADNSDHVLSGVGVTDVQLDGLVITGGSANNTNIVQVAIQAMSQPLVGDALGQAQMDLDPSIAGGGLVFANSPGMLTNSSPNFATTDLTILGCIFVNNSAQGFGGGLAVHEARVNCQNSQFLQNFSDWEGGGYWGQNQLGTFQNSTFTGNGAFRSGGGVQLETIPSRRTTSGGMSDAVFASTFGVTLTNLVTGVATAQSLDSLAFDTVAAYLGGDTNNSSLTALDARFEKDSFSLATAVLAKTPVVAKVSSYVLGKLGYAGSLLKATSIVGVLSSAFDVGVQLSILGGADPNSKFVKGWNLFFTNFNEYASPGGWLTLYFNEIIKLWNLANIPPPYIQAATTLRQTDASYYNKLPVSYFNSCQFTANTSAGTGGALMDNFDNVQVQSTSFTGNKANANAGAAAFTSYAHAYLMSDSFVSNSCAGGCPAILTAFHPNVKVINCTIVDNSSASTNAFAVDNEVGSDVLIANSILWGNTSSNSACLHGGADLFTSTYSSLDTNSQSIYTQSGNAHWEYVSRCDLRSSDVQSLHSIPVGASMYWFDLPGLPTDPQGVAPTVQINYNPPLESYQIQYLEEVGVMVTNFVDYDLAGIADYEGFYDVGEGNRATLTNAYYGNISVDPQLVSGVMTVPSSAVVGAGDPYLLTYAYDVLPGIYPDLNDLYGNGRVQNADVFAEQSVDMGAEENYGAPNSGIQKVVYVNAHVVGGNGSGTDWADAMRQIPLDLTSNVAPGSAIWVAAGTYNITGDYAIYLEPGISIYGGFAGGETNTAQSNPQRNPTILTRGDQGYLLVSFTGVGPTVIHGITFTGLNNPTLGAGALTVTAPATVENCEFVSNSAAEGIVVVDPSSNSVSFNNCGFFQNSGSDTLFSYGGDVKVRNCLFQHNNAGYNADGVIEISDGTAEISGTAMTQNSGGIRAEDGTHLLLQNCSIVSNSFASFGGLISGAGVSFVGATSSIVNTIIYGNVVTGISEPVEEQQFDGVGNFKSSDIQGLTTLANPATSGCLDVNPYFENGGINGDINLAANSPFINAGVSNVVAGLLFPTDLNGNSRVVGTIDIGATEFQGTPAPAAVVPLSMVQSCGGLPQVTLTVTQPVSLPPLTGYQWQINRLDGLGFVPLTDGAPYAGSSTLQLSITGAEATNNDFFYRLASTNAPAFSTPVAEVSTYNSILYVNPRAYGANNGLDWFDAFTNLQSALSAAHSCSQIWVAAGTYQPAGTTSFVAPATAVQIYGGFAGTETNLAQRDLQDNVTLLENTGRPVLDFSLPRNAGFVTTVDGCQIQGTQAAGGYMQMAVTIDNETVMFHQCEFVSNTVVPILNQDGAQLAVNDCLFTGNQNASGTAGLGNWGGGTAVVSDSQFIGNSGLYSGAIENSAGSSLMVSRCTFEENQGTNYAGAIQNNGAATVAASLFRGNISGNCGGAMANAGSALTIVNSTIVGNYATLYGGGVFDQGAGMAVWNSILWGNTLLTKLPRTVELGQLDVEFTNATASVNNSLVQGLSLYAGHGNSLANPLFIDEAGGNFQLAAGSPGINAGSAAAPSLPGLDLSSHSLPYPGTAPDIGAFEFQGAGSAPVSLLSIPAFEPSCAGQPVSFSITGLPGSTYSFQWQMFNGAVFTNLLSSPAAQITQQGATSTLAITNPGVYGGTLVRLSVNNGAYLTSPLLITNESPNIIYVSTLSYGDNPQDGTTWSTPFKTIQAALAVASPCSQIWVAQGTYTGPVTPISGVSIYGGFAGGESSVNERYPGENISTLVSDPANIDSLAVSSQGSPAADTTAILDGFYISGSSNRAVFISHSSPTFQNCVVVGNTTGIWVDAGGSPVFRQCVFTNNTDSALYFNQAQDPQVLDCLFTSNSIADAGEAGAAIQAWQSTADIADSQFIGNTADEDSAIQAQQSSSLVIERCLFAGNISRFNGSAVGMHNSTLTLDNSLFTANTNTLDGGSVYAISSQLNLVNDTFSGNASAGICGGLYEVNGSLAMLNCIFWQNLGSLTNTTVEWNQVYLTGVSPVISHTIIDGLSEWQNGQANNLAWDPIFVDPTNGNFQLSSNSPALDIGGTAGLTTNTLDLADNPRFNGTNIDLGAYEFSGAAGTPSYLHDDLSSRTICAGSGTSFTVTFSSGTPFAVQWQVDISNQWTVIPTNSVNPTITTTSQGSTLAIASADLSLDGTQYRYVTTGTGGNVSRPSTVYVVPRTQIYVDATASGAGTGGSWADAFTTIGPALAAADNCTAVWVAEGTYPQSQTLSPLPGVEIDGGFPVGGGQWADRNPSLHPTIITAATGPLFTNVLLSLEQADPVGERTVIDGVDFSNATMGVSVSYRSPIFQNCDFENIAGNAVVSSPGNPLFTNCVFSGNLESAILAGGYSTVIVQSSLFSSNQYSAIQAAASQLTVQNSEFVNNSSPYSGGALEVYESAVTVTASVFSNNFANSGGAVDVEPDSSLLLRDCSLTGNSADFTGGAVANSGTLSVINCTMANNLAQYEGGGLAQYQGSAGITNSIFWGNNSADAELTNTESANLYLQSGSAGLFAFTDDLIQFQQTPTGSGVTGVNPLFEDAADGNFALAANSPAINAGNNSYVMAGDTDVTGAARIQQGTVDLGAYESGASGAGLIYVLSLPASTTVYSGFPAGFAVTTAHEYAFQWQYNRGGGWTNLADGDVVAGSTFAIAGGVGTNSILGIANTTQALDGLQVRVQLAGESFASPAVTLTVLADEIMYVDASVGTNGDGTSWGSAYKTLSAAIDALEPYRSTIYVAQGTYAGGTTIFQGAALYGGFPTGGGLLAARDWQANPTIVTGGSEADASVLTFDGSEALIDSNSVADGFVLQGGAPGLDIFDASPTLRNLLVQGNANGGLYVQGSPLLQNCFFENNTNDSGGGGATIYGSPVFLDCAFQGNVAGGSSYPSGGALLIASGHPQLLNVLITGNTAGHGGAIYALAPFLLVNSTVSGNYATATAGGIDASYGLGTVENSILWKNRDPLNQTEEAQAVVNKGVATLQFTSTTIEGLATFSGVGVVSRDPLFAAALDASPAASTNGNFQLSACSPAIDAGNNADAASISNDLAGQPRLVGTVDMGAYEFSGVPATALLITAQPADLIYQNGGGGNAYSVAATGDGLTYEWQMAPPGGAFATLQGNGNFTGATTPFLTVNAADPGMNGSLIRCEVTSSSGCVADSREALLTVYPNRYYVNGRRPDDTGDGLTWATAFQTLQQAARAPVNPAGSAIWVAAGTYSTLQFANGDLFYGGFAGTETNLSQRNWTVNPTILQAATNFTVTTGSSPYGAVIVSCFTNYLPATNYPITLGRMDGFQLRNASTAIIAEGGTTGFTIANCTFTNCYFGVWAYSGSTVQIDHCQFENLSIGYVDDSGSGTVSNSVFAANGGGIELDDASLVVAGCGFIGNGSGIVASTARVISSLTVSDSTFAGNVGEALDLGGEIELDVSAERCAFRGNGSTNVNLGGAVYIGNQVENAWFGDCLFSGNYAQSGGAVYNDGYNAVFQNCTFAGNRNTAIYNNDSGSAGLAVYNSVFWNNSDIAGNAPYWWLSAYYGAYTNSPNAQLFSLGGNRGNNIVENGNGPGLPAPNGFTSGSVSVDPGFVSPLDPGAAPSTNGDFHVTPCSSIIGLGTPSQVTLSATDLDGQPRLYEGSVTPGAYEPASAPLVFSTEPTNAVGILNQTIAFAATVTNATGATYNWQVNTGGGVFIDLTDAPPYAGVTSTQLTFIAAVGENGNAYRLRAAYPTGCSIYSTAAAFSLYTPALSATGANPNGILPLPGTNFGFSLPGGVNAGTLNDQSVSVYGMESGRLRFGDGSLRFTINGSSVTLNPARALHPGEQVFITVNSSLQSANGFAAAPRTWSFINDVTSWDGSFDATQTVALPGSPTANLVQAGDLNGDGSIDLFVSTAAGCRVLTNNGTGTFTDSGQTLGTDAASKIILGNVRGQGLLDVVLLRDGAVEVWTNSDAGVFTRAAQYTSVTVTDVALGDLNNDGLMDLFVLTATDNRVWWNAGAGSFMDSGLRLAAINSASVALGDFNEDGNLDAYVVHGDATPGQLWVNQGGSFVAGAGSGVPSVASGYQRVLAGDMANSGHVDLLTVANGSVQIWKGNGAGSFSSYYQTGVVNPNAVAVGDVNGDRQADLILATGAGALAPAVGVSGGYRSLYHQGAFANGTATALADLNGDGALDLAVISPSGQLNVSMYQPVQLYGTENTGTSTAALPIYFSTFESLFETRYGGVEAMKILSVPTNGVLTWGPYILSPGNVVDFEEVYYTYGDPEIHYLGNTGSSGLDSFTWQGVDAYYRPGGAVPPPEPNVFTFYVSIAPIISVTAQNDFAAVNQGQSVSVLTNGVTSVLANDVDDGGSGLTAVLTVPPAHGTAQLNADGTFTYTHDGSETHSDSFSYQAVDVSGHSGTATVFITINNVNNTPTAINLAQNIVYEGRPSGLLVGQLSTIDPDPEAGGYVYTFVTGAGDTDNASFALSTNEIVTTAPLSYATGATRSIRIRSTDAEGAYFDQALTVQLTPLPVANSQSEHWNENGPPLYVQLTGSASKNLQYILLSQPTNGTLTGTPPVLTYQPDHQFTGLDGFTFETSDGVMTSAVASVTIIMDSIDEAPVTQSTNFTAQENAPLALSLAATPYLPGNPVQFNIVTPPNAGSITGTGTNFVYVPATNHFGNDWFAFAAVDTALNQTSAVYIAQITVAPSDTPPVAYAETVQATQNDQVVFSINAADINSSLMTYTIVTPPQHGILSSGFLATPQSIGPILVSYLPTNSFTGTDTFTFVAGNGRTNSAPATVTINVGTPELPLANAQTVATTEGQPVNITLTGSDPLGQTLYFQLAGGAGHGVVSGTPPNLTYTPFSTNYYGTDTFRFVTLAGNRESLPATVTVTVQRTYVSPIALSEQYTNYGVPVAIQLQASDPQGLSLTYQVVSAPTNGTLSATNFPLITYAPRTNFYGQDAFSFVVSDGMATSAVATIVFEVIEPEHAPSVPFFGTNVFAGLPVTINVLGLASDAANDPLTLVGILPASNGSLSVTNGMVTYVTTATVVDRAHSFDSFGYVVSNHFETATGYVSIGIYNRQLLVGYPYNSAGGTPAVFAAGTLMSFDTLPNAVKFANSFGPALEWTINLFGPTVLSTALTNTPDGSLSALGITGNIRFVPIPDAYSLAPPLAGISLSVDPAAPAMRMFQVAPGARLRLENYTLTGGEAGQGGAVYNAGRLELVGSAITGAMATNNGYGPGEGGAIFNYNGIVTLTNSALTNDVADLGGGIYQVGDGAAAALIVSNGVMSANSSPQDFVSTVTNGGTSAITSALLAVDHPSLPWFGPLAASYAVAQDFSVTFPILLDPDAFPFSVSTASNDLAGLEVTGTAGTQRTLSLSLPPGSVAGPEAVSITAGNGALSYTENFQLTVNPADHNPPVAATVYAACPPSGGVLIPVLPGAQNVDGLGQLSVVSAQNGQYGQVVMKNNQLLYSNTIPVLYPATDSFTYEVSNGYLTSTGTVVLVIVPLTQIVYNNSDAEFGSLRSALNYVNQYYSDAGWTIVFAADQFNYLPADFDLTSMDDASFGGSALVVNQKVTIDGSTLTNAVLQVDPAASMRVVHVASGASLTLVNFTVSGGVANADAYEGGIGGGILNEGNLSLSNCVVTDNTAEGTTNEPGEGGAIFNRGAVFAANTILTNNSALIAGGVFQVGDAGAVTVQFTNCLVSNPLAARDTVSTVLHGGQAAILADGTAIANPGPPSVSSVNDQFITGSATIPIFLISTNYDDVQVAVQSANTNVAPTAGLTLTGSGNVRQLSLAPQDNGISHVTVTLSENGVSFGRGFGVGTTGGTPVNPVANDAYYTLYRGQTVVLPVLQNDVDPGGLTLQLLSVSPVAAGTTVISNNEVIYASSGGTVTNDYFTYVATNNLGGGVTGRVFITAAQPQITVDNLYQSAAGSLRGALNTAGTTPLGGGVPWTIVIDPSLAGQTLTLLGATLGESSDYTAFVISNYVRIDGSRAPGFTIAGNLNEYAGPYLRLFRITSTGDLELSGLNLTDGDAFIYAGSSPGTLAEGNRAGLGGAIFNEGIFGATNVLFAGNDAAGGNNGSLYPGLGGAVFNNAGAVKIVGCTFANNQAQGNGTGGNLSAAVTGALGGAIFNYNGTLDLVSNVFTNNSAWQAASVASVGDGSTASVWLHTEDMTNGVDALDLLGEAVNGGFSRMTSFQTNLMTPGAPSISTIADQVVSNAVAVPFTFTFASTNPVVTATSADASVASADNVVIATNDGTGTVTITPGAFAGRTAVTLLLTDGALSYAQVFHVAVVGPPSPQAETFRTLATQPVTFDMLARFAGTGLALASYNTNGLIGLLTNLSDGTFTYDPNGQFDSLAAGQTATNTFTCLVTNAANQSATFTISVIVTGINYPPVAMDVEVTRQSGQSLQIPVATLLAAVSDPEGSTVYLGAFDTNSANGAVISEDGNMLLFVPPPGNDAPDSFNFSAFDPEGAFTTGTVFVLTADSTLLSSADPAGFRDPLTFTATEPAAATGVVVFYTNNVPWSTNLLDDGAAVSGATALLPRGTNLVTAVYAGDDTYAGSTNTVYQVVTNHPPVAAVYTLTRTAGLTLHIFLTSLATNWSDADGDPVILAGINLLSTNGVTLLTNSTQILYAHASNVNDQIRYTISDGQGGAGTGLINVVVTSPFIAGTQAPGAFTIHNGTLSTFFFGIPSYVYEVQRSTNLNAGIGWVTISTNTVGPGGLINVLDSFPDLGGNVPASAYYRLGWQP